MINPTLRDVLRAAVAIRGLARQTPLEPSWALDGVTGATTWLKLENLQVTGSFKLRGALNCVSCLSEEERARGLLAASSGNHAQGLAMAARHFGCRSTVVVPAGIPALKVENCRRLGAEVLVGGRDFDAAEATAQGMAAETGATLVHSFADPRVIAGQGTVALEMLAADPDLDLFVVPAGGGGLIGGVATAVKAINPAARVVGVQSVASPPWYYSFRAGRLVEVELHDSIAEGLHGSITDPPFRLVLDLVDDIVLVEEEEIVQAVRWLVRHHRLVAEPSGAIGVAALLGGHIPAAGRRVGVILSGGNADPERLTGWLS